jgi:hypothetical protein
MNRIVFTIPEKGLIVVVRKGKTTNKKISNGSHLVQTYTFSQEQYDLANNGSKITQKEFFALDGANCLDCPYSGNMGAGGCYTHKFMQYSGFLSMLRSITNADLTPLTIKKEIAITEMCSGAYVRFGTYGEPSLIPKSVVDAMVSVGKTWTGYTHQWKKEWARGYKEWFMASTHDQQETNKAGELGFRSFVSVVKGHKVRGVNCPASKEQGFKSNCESCGLCSGLVGKGKKDIWIYEH